MDRPYYSRSGIVLVYKGVGVSSNAVVNKVKYLLGAKKCGHLGTLDLEGEGLLPVTVNKATKLFDWFLNKTKTYQANFVFGVETDTLDSSGKVTHSMDCDITESEVKRVLPQMIGKYKQVPPQFSAKKVNGKIAYKEARQGNVVQLQPKEIEIFDFRLIKKIDKNTFRFEINCSSGTYVRSLARDLAEKLGTYGIMQCILRTRCDMFRLEDAKTLEQLEKGKIEVVPCDKFFDFKSIKLDLKQAERAYNDGLSIDVDEENGKYKVYNDSDFLGIGEVVDKRLTFKLRLF